MIYEQQTVTCFNERIGQGETLLSLDYGAKRTGIAASDSRRVIASPLSIVETKDIFREISKLIKERNAGGIVIGLPLQMDGIAGKMALEVKEFASKLERSFGVPILLWDERLSSRAVETFLVKEANIRGKKKKAHLDSNAACYILQGVLDRIANLS